MSIQAKKAIDPKVTAVASEIVIGIIETDQPNQFREDLREIWETYVTNTDQSPEVRRSMFYSYKILDSALLEMQSISDIHFSKK